MKMSGFIVMLLAGLVVCGCLIYRHQYRLAEGAAPVGQRPVNDLRPSDLGQQSSKLASPGHPDWREKLRREEEKQRPSEGRN